MKKDYFIIATEKDRIHHYQEKRFVIRTKNALEAEKIAKDFLKDCEKKEKKEWRIWDIKRIN